MRNALLILLAVAVIAAYSPIDLCKAFRAAIRDYLYWVRTRWASMKRIRGRYLDQR